MLLQNNVMILGDSMISGGKSTGTTTLVIDKTEEIDLSPRILELRKKIQSQEYLDNAIQRIAQVISNHLIEYPDELKLRD
ncbi:hypothetical protein [Treponema sp. Marseille-Q3903]|uniref:hypothetical protein n=1 Tax=Treponema sp. Marseille-Q3903 TaxID=2766703 RepID=UPI0021036373|nr:hypothetical protein [Treponema sp. Marseille-Q3903]